MINNLKKSLRPMAEEVDIQYPSSVHAIEAVDSEGHEPYRIGTFPVHVSTAINFCARQHWLAEQSPKPLYKHVTSADRVLWAIGKAIEKHNRTSMMKAYGKHNAYGKWTCKCESLMSFGLGRDPVGKRCPKCKTGVLFEYHEMPLQLSDLVIGNPDLMICKDQPKKLRIIEYKSIKKEDFDNLVVPSFRYKMQAYMYLKLLEANIHRFQEVGVDIDLENYEIIYTSKGYKFSHQGSVHKVFVINVNELSESFKQEYEQVISDIKMVQKTTEIPKRELCDSVTCAHAKTCPVRNDCFSWGD